MKNLQSYEYEKSMLDYLNETFQKALREYACLEKHQNGSSSYERQGEIADRCMDKAIAQKELVESVIGECVNLQKDGVIRIGADKVVDYTDYLDTLHKECRIGEVFGKTLLEDDGKVTGGISYFGETLADFIDDYKDSYDFHPTPDGKYKYYDYEKINQALYDCGIKPLRYDGGGRFVPITEKEQTAKYAIHRYGNGEVTVNLPKKEVWRGEETRFYGERIEKLETLCDEPKITIPRYILGEFFNDSVDIVVQIMTDCYNEFLHTADDADGLIDFIRENYPSFDYYGHSNIEACAGKLDDAIQGNIVVENTSTDNPDYVRIELSANAVLDMYDTSGAVRSIVGDRYYESNNTLKLDIPRTYVKMYLSYFGLSEGIFENSTAINLSQADKYVWDKLPKWFSVLPFKHDLRDYEVARNDITFASGYDVYGNICEQVKKPISTIKKSHVIMDKKPSNTQIKE